MGFNKIYLPQAKELKKMLQDDRESTLRWLGKADAVIGCEESVKLMNRELKKKHCAR